MKLKRIIMGGLVLAGLSTSLGCDGKEQKPLDAIAGVPELPASSVGDTITGVPKLPASFITKNNYSTEGYVSFVLDLPDGKEVLCSYNGLYQTNKVADIDAVVKDAHLDKQAIGVYGKLVGNRMSFLEVNHPDFDRIKLMHNSKGAKHPEYQKSSF